MNRYIYKKQRRKGVKACLKSKVLYGKKKERKFKIKIKVESQNKKSFDLSQDFTPLRHIYITNTLRIFYPKE
jgi:hypothetical protein